MRYAPIMLGYLYALSSVLFYAVGMLAFGSYILVRNDIVASLAVRFLQVVDLPLVALGLLLGGCSLLRSFRDPARGTSLILVLGISVPLALAFCCVLFLQFFV